MRPQPAPQQRPEPFHGIHMDFTQAVAIFIASELSSSMIDTLMVVSPEPQAGINAIFIRVHKRIWHDGVFDEGLDRLLLHIGHQLDHYLTSPLNHPQDRRPLFFQGATTTFAFESASTSFSSLIFYYLRLAFMAGNHIGFVALHLV